MNYEKYLNAAGVTDPFLRQEALDYLNKCKQDHCVNVVTLPQTGIIRRFWCKS